LPGRAARPDPHRNAPYWLAAYDGCWPLGAKSYPVGDYVLLLPGRKIIDCGPTLIRTLDGIVAGCGRCGWRNTSGCD